MTTYSFDIHLLGLKDPSSAGRARFCDGMARITGRPQHEFAPLLEEREPRIFESLAKEQATEVIDKLATVGVRVEIRPSSAIPVSAEDQIAHTVNCPSCEFIQPAGELECPRCGLVFAKWERENIVRMQREQNLQDAVTRSLQIREEWRIKAQQYLETKPLPPESVTPFEGSLVPEEVPFLALAAEQGSVLLTSRRMLLLLDGKIVSMPYELLSDVDFGGGLIQNKDKVRMQLSFHVPLMIGESETSSMAWQLDKESSFFKDIVMDWAFARHFICGACGAADFQYRSEELRPFARCMHCAVDHEIDTVEAVTVPQA